MNKDNMSERHYILITNRIRANVAIESLNHLMGPVDGEEFGITSADQSRINEAVAMLHRIEQRLFRMMDS